MLTYSFENIGKTPLYEYLYNCIKNDILNGKIKPGEKLPSKRSLSKHLQISTITIENTYNLLMSEGYIFSISRKGFFVEDIKQIINEYTPISKSRTNESKAKSLNELSTLSNLNTFSKAMAFEKKTPYLIDFTDNSTSPANFPFSNWAKISRQVLSLEQDKVMENPSSGGVFDLRNAIANHLSAFRGINCSPWQIVVGAGTEFLFNLLVQFLGQDNIFAFENPGYNKLEKISCLSGLNYKLIPLDKSGPDMNILQKSDANIMHVTSSHHFPTGITIPIGRRYELLSWVSEDDKRIIIEDDFDSEFRMTGRPVPSLFQMDMTGQVIYMNTFTKTLASTVRISYMVLPPLLVNKFYEKMGFYSNMVPSMEQIILSHFIDEGYYEKHINRMRNLYKKKRDKLMSVINKSPLNALCSISEENAGLHFLLKIKGLKNTSEYKKNLLKEGIRISALNDYYSDETKNHKTGETKNHKGDCDTTFVINYSNIDDDKISPAIDALYTSLVNIIKKN